MDFSHHPKLCKKTQHSQFNKKKPILKLACWTLLQQSTQTCAEVQTQGQTGRSSSSGWWEASKGKVSGLASVGEPSSRDHIKQPTASTCSWGAGVQCKTHFLAHYQIFSMCNAFTCNESRALSWVTGDKQDWFMTGSAAHSVPPRASAPCRNTAAIEADLCF